jgi:hypothetical protein
MSNVEMEYLLFYHCFFFARSFWFFSSSCQDEISGLSWEPSGARKRAAAPRTRHLTQVQPSIFRAKWHLRTDQVHGRLLL